MKPFRVGDRVSFSGMKGTVAEIQPGECFDPVWVDFGKDVGHYSFSLDGRWHKEQTRPVLKHLRPKYKKGPFVGISKEHIAKALGEEPREWWIDEGRVKKHPLYDLGVVYISDKIPQSPDGWIKVKECLDET